MKDKKKLWLLPFICLLLTGCGAEKGRRLWPVIIVVLAVLLLALAAVRTYHYLRYLQRRKGRRRKPMDSLTVGIYGVAIMLLLIAVLGSVEGRQAEAPPQETVATEPPTEPPVTIDLQESWPSVLYGQEISAASYFVYDLDDGTFLISSPNLQENTIYPASVTKLFTGYVALQCLDPAQEVMVGYERTLVDGTSSVAGIYWGDYLTVEELIAGMFLPSGNDAAYTLAVTAGRHLAGDPDMDMEEAIRRFVEEMNTQAQMEGMTGSHFVTPDGFHDDDHYMSAQDLAILAGLVLDHTVLAKYAGTLDYTLTLSEDRVLDWHNTNLLLDPNSAYYCPYAVGLKTGYTTPGGNCLLSAFRVEHENLVIGAFGSQTSDARYVDTLLLLTQKYDLQIPAPVEETTPEDTQ